MKTQKKVCHKTKIFENLKIIKSLKIKKTVWKQLKLIIKKISRKNKINLDSLKKSWRIYNNQ